ncbi:MAG: hypothetical protein ACHQHN_14650 [Sphingobacteriales bacterium]
MESVPKTNHPAKSRAAIMQDCHSSGLGRLNPPTIAKAMERMMR